MVLAHAYFTQSDECREIHFDCEENSYYGTDNDVPSGKKRFLNSLVHELGHSLGLSHRDDESSIMYPCYQENTVKSLSDGDQTAIKLLYEPSVSTSLSMTMTTVPVFSSPTVSVFSSTIILSLGVVTFRNNNSNDRN